jgi:hypothetical protein
MKNEEPIYIHIEEKRPWRLNLGAIGAVLLCLSFWGTILLCYLFR